MYKIYFTDKPFYITNQLTPELHKLAYTHGTIMLNQSSETAIKQAVADIEGKALAVIVLTDNVEANLGYLKNFLVHIRAGGGLVKNERDEYLFIYRRGKWDLPKGKLDDGEAIETCALREVWEETGLQNIELGHHLLDTWHFYEGWGQRVLKQTTWFSMTSLSGQPLTPQLEEDIQEVAWLKKADWAKVLENTFPSVVDTLNSLTNV